MTLTFNSFLVSVQMCELVMQPTGLPQGLPYIIVVFLVILSSLLLVVPARLSTRTKIGLHRCSGHCHCFKTSAPLRVPACRSAPRSQWRGTRRAPPRRLLDIGQRRRAQRDPARAVVALPAIHEAAVPRRTNPHAETRLSRVPDRILARRCLQRRDIGVGHGCGAIRRRASAAPTIRAGGLSRRPASSRAGARVRGGPCRTGAVRSGHVSTPRFIT